MFAAPSLTVGVLHLRVIQRLDAHVIADEKQRSLFIVPKRECKHAVQTRETVLAPLGPRSQQNFRIRMRAKLMTFGGELFAQLAIVVNLSVQDHDEAPIVRQHRLMPRATGIDDRQTPMTDTNTLSCIIDR